ncbi:hypothetical protein DFH06DRAFT_1145368 [Mycena polygramma]|nr:hypothetical protein DFH06DRAFT_1145368 [Mycena polygramma]
MANPSCDTTPSSPIPKKSADDAALAQSLRAEARRLSQLPRHSAMRCRAPTESPEPAKKRVVQRKGKPRKLAKPELKKHIGNEVLSVTRGKNAAASGSKKDRVPQAATMRKQLESKRGAGGGPPATLLAAGLDVFGPTDKPASARESLPATRIEDGDVSHPVLLAETPSTVQDTLDKEFHRSIPPPSNGVPPFPRKPVQIPNVPAYAPEDVRDESLLLPEPVQILTLFVHTSKDCWNFWEIFGVKIGLAFDEDDDRQDCGEHTWICGEGWGSGRLGRSAKEATKHVKHRMVEVRLRHGPARRLAEGMPSERNGFSDYGTGERTASDVLNLLHGSKVLPIARSLLAVQETEGVDYFKS